jgi:hypothetical protein
MTAALPLFVVVGNVNQGKSSVVAALTEDEAVPIDSFPGTTRRCAEYVFRAGDQPLFRIVDTPGFQRARHVLAWLASRAHNAAERPAAVRSFVGEHGAAAGFPDEVELLRPILQDAGILYVVDASGPVEPANEAEMEILRWTGQPAMALLNRVRGRDYSREWRPVLSQFFHIVREFDAHRARFPERIALLRGFREIRPEWSTSIDAAVTAMEREWTERSRRAAGVLADLLISGLGHVERAPLPEGADEAQVRSVLEETYRDAQRRHEATARGRIETIYRHAGIDREDCEFDFLASDLFSESIWRVFGLTTGQLVRGGAIGGAATGAGIDLMVGGHSFLAGTVVGALFGGAAAFVASRKIASVWSSASRAARALFPGDTGRFLAMGPVTSPRYAWVLLDRALVHFRAVRDRSHARRGPLEAGDQAMGVVAHLPAGQRDALASAFAGVLKDARLSRSLPETRRALELRLGEVMAALAPRT